MYFRSNTSIKTGKKFPFPPVNRVVESENDNDVDDTNDTASSTYTDIFDVVIMPDAKYGLGLRLDNQNDRIIVMNFKKHPGTNSPMSVESSGLVQVP